MVDGDIVEESIITHLINHGRGNYGLTTFLGVVCGLLGRYDDSRLVQVRTSILFQHEARNERRE